MEELGEALKSLKRGKSMGVDNIPNELLLDGGDTTKHYVLALMNEVFTTKRPPKTWLATTITPIPKKGDLTKVDNHRGIALMSAVAKLYNRCILNRLREGLEPLISDSQAGFRRGRSTKEQIHILRRLIEGASDKNLELVITFVDFKKAFDSVYRPYMWAVLRAYGVPQDMVDAIKCLYTGNVGQIKLPDGTLSEEIPMETGVLQGDTLAPYLFIIVLDYALNKTIQPEFGFVTYPATGTRPGLRSGSHLDMKVHHLAFADDAALCDTAIKQAEAHLKCVQEKTKPTGLDINILKTEFMRVGTSSEAVLCDTDTKQAEAVNEASPEGKIQLDGKDIKETDLFKYLGSLLSSNPRIHRSEDFKQRRHQAWNVFWKLSKVWRAKVDLAVKYSVWRATVVAILFYASETWILTADILTKMDTFQRRCLRIMLGIHWEQRVSTRDLLNQVEAELQAPLVPLSEVASERQQNWLLHIMRAEYKTADGAVKPRAVSTYALWAPHEGHGKRGRGHPFTSFLKAYQAHTGTEHTEEDLKRLAWKNRK